MSKRRGKNKRKLSRQRMAKPLVRPKPKATTLYDEWFEYLRLSGLCQKDRHLKALRLSSLKVKLYGT